LRKKFVLPAKIGYPLTLKEKNELIRRGIPESIANIATPSSCGLASGGKYKFPKLISMDLEIRVLGYKTNKKMKFLNTDKLSKEVAKKIPEEDCDLCEFLKQSFDGSDPEEETFISYYRQGNEYVMGLYGEGDPNVEFRNKHWMKNIRASFENGSAFLAVGAAHLYGEKGILKELERDGASVVRWPPLNVE